MSGTFYICGNHIGNIEDIPSRVKDALLISNYVITEDQEAFLEMIRFLKIDKEFEIIVYEKQSNSYYVDENKIKEILDSGQNVAYIVKNGMPQLDQINGNIITNMWRLGANVKLIPGPVVPGVAFSFSGLSSPNGYIYYDSTNNSEQSLTEFLNSIKTMKQATIILEKRSRADRCMELIDTIVGDNRHASLIVNMGIENQTVCGGRMPYLRENLKNLGPSEDCIIIFGGINRS